MDSPPTSTTDTSSSNGFRTSMSSRRQRRSGPSEASFLLSPRRTRNSALILLGFLWICQSSVSFQPITIRAQHYHYNIIVYNSNPLLVEKDSSITTTRRKIAARHDSRLSMVASTPGPTGPGSADFNTYADTSRTTPLRQTTTATSSSSSAAALGKWEEVEGNFILRPATEDGPPRALGTNERSVCISLERGMHCEGHTA